MHGSYYIPTLLLLSDYTLSPNRNSPTPSSFSSVGWRHWKAFYAHINQSIMESMMDELATKRPVDGVPTSLADLGYLYTGLDDHWQNCTRVCADGSVVPSYKPGTTSHGTADWNYQCCLNKTTGICNNTGSKVLPWYDQKGAPRVDTVRFPNMRGMVQKAHSLGLRAGWYMGNYQCSAGVPNDVPTATLVEGSVKAIADFGFDSVKLDSGVALTKVRGEVEKRMRSGGKGVET